MQVAVFINAAAGSATRPETSADRLAELFKKFGMNPQIHYVDPAKFSETIRSALKTPPELIVVGGGDGTVSSAAGLLAGTSVTLGLLPLGTLNHFCKDLKIPEGVEDAVALLAQVPPRQIDVGEINGRVFINNCSLGAYPAAVQHRDRLRHEKGHSKWPAMALAWCNVIRRLRRLRLHLTLDGASLNRRTPMVLISNNRYEGHLFSKSLRERLDQGLLSVYSTRTHRILPLLRLVFLAVLGRLRSAEEFESWNVKTLEIAASGSSYQVGVDGEVVTFDLPLRFRIRPGALRVIAPPSPSAKA